MKLLKKIEEHFGMPFRNVMEDLHLAKGVSVLRLSVACGVSRHTINKLAKEIGIVTNNIKKAALSTPLKKGESHWAYGKTKDNSEWAMNASKRMTKNNPSKNKKTREKMSASISETYKKNLLPQEKIFKEMLEEKNINFVAQHPIGTYIIDFFIPLKNLCVEIDSTDKWGRERRNLAEIKDRFLEKKGYDILRINKRFLANKEIMNKHLLFIAN